MQRVLSSAINNVLHLLYQSNTGFRSMASNHTCTTTFSLLETYRVPAISLMCQCQPYTGQFGNIHTSSATSKTFKSKIDASRVPELREEDLEEKFILGWGPGGQAINKTASAVFLRHKPTGLFVKVQIHRLRQKNEIEARKLLQEKLDDLVNGENSVSAQKQRLALQNELKKSSRARKRREMKRQWKEHACSAGTGCAADIGSAEDQTQV